MTDKLPENTTKAKAAPTADTRQASGPAYNGEYLHKLWNSWVYPTSMRDSFNMPEAIRRAAKVEDISEEWVPLDTFRLRYPTLPGTQEYRDQAILLAHAPFPVPPLRANNFRYGDNVEVPYYWKDKTRYLQERWEPQYYIPDGTVEDSPYGYAFSEMDLHLLRVAPDYAQLSRNLNDPTAPAITPEERDQWQYRVRNQCLLPTYNWWNLGADRLKSDRSWILSNEDNTGHITASVAIPGHALSESGVPYAATVRIRDLRFNPGVLDRVGFAEGDFKALTDKLVRIETLTQYLHMAQMAPAMLLSASERREYEQALGLPLEQAELHQRLEIPRKHGLAAQEARMGNELTRYWTAMGVDEDIKARAPMLLQATYPAQHTRYRYQRLESAARNRMGPEAEVPARLIAGAGDPSPDQGRPLYLQRTDAQWEQAMANSAKESLSAGAGLATPLNQGLAYLGLGALAYLSPARKIRYENADAPYLLTNQPLQYPQDLPSMRLAAGRDRLMSDYTEVLTKATVAQDPRYRLFHSASALLQQVHPQEDKSAARLDIISLCPPDGQGKRRVMPLGTNTQDVREMMAHAQQSELLAMWEEVQSLKDSNMALRKTFHAVVLDAQRAQEEKPQLSAQEQEDLLHAQAEFEAEQLRIFMETGEFPRVDDPRAKTSPEGVTRGKRLSRLSETHDESSARLRTALYNQVGPQKPAHASGRDLRDMVRTARIAPHDMLVEPLMAQDAQGAGEYRQTLMQLHESLAALYGSRKQRKEAQQAIRERVTGEDGEVREFAAQRKADTWSAVLAYRDQLRDYAMQAMPGYQDLPDAAQANQVVENRYALSATLNNLRQDYPDLWPKGPWANYDDLQAARETFPPTVRDDVPVLAPPTLEPRPPSGKIQPHMGDRLTQVQGMLEYLTSVTGKPELEVFKALQSEAHSPLHSPDMAPYKDVHVVAEAAAKLAGAAAPAAATELPAATTRANLPKGRP